MNEYFLPLSPMHHRGIAKRSNIPAARTFSRALLVKFIKSAVCDACSNRALRSNVQLTTNAVPVHFHPVPELWKCGKQKLGFDY